jgi:hypothetical protein
VTQVIYDEEACQYWEVKKHVPKIHRNKLEKPSGAAKCMVDRVIDKMVKAVPECQITTYSGITAQDRIDMIEEYEDLQREIYNLIC